jgi:hypothetical protein
MEADSAKDWKEKELDAVIQTAVSLIKSKALELAMDSDAKGRQWEREFFDKCLSLGLGPIEDVSGRADGRVRSKNVQCKSIDRITNGWIDISNMRPVKSKGGLRGYTRDEVDVFAIKHRGRVFLVPTDSICADGIHIAGKVRISDIQQFDDNWAVFDDGYISPRIDGQSLLFGDEAE